jgi:predicted Fe-Mo cluster-binding NifX family protein
MITAIPMNEDRIANHFSKAETFLFINEQGEEVSQHVNPVHRGHCDGKKSLVDLLTQQHAERIIVRNIGQQMLGKLLAQQLEVFQSGSGRRSTAELANPEAVGLVALTEVAQGRPSVNHATKQKEGGCRHHQKAGSEQGRCCQQDEEQTGQPGHHHHKGCHNGHKRSHGRCGQGRQKGRHGCCHRGITQ